MVVRTDWLTYQRMFSLYYESRLIHSVEIYKSDIPYIFDDIT